MNLPILGKWCQCSNMEKASWWFYLHIYNCCTDSIMKYALISQRVTGEYHGRLPAGWSTWGSLWLLLNGIYLPSDKYIFHSLDKGVCKLPHHHYLCVCVWYSPWTQLALKCLLGRGHQPPLVDSKWRYIWSHKRWQSGPCCVGRRTYHCLGNSI